MLPIKTLIYLFFFVSCCGLSVFYTPVIGVYGYLAAYNINPLSQWWGNYLPAWAERYSFILAACIAIGTIINFNKLKFKSLLDRQEVLLILFWLVVVFSNFLGQGYSETQEYIIFKVSKFSLIILVASHVVTRLKHYDGLLWVLIISGFWLSSELFFGAGSFRGARFHGGVGGSDFGEGNFLAAHFGMLVPMLGIMILKGNWKTRLLCCAGAVFLLNAIVLIRSRGAFLALFLGAVVTFFYSFKIESYRKLILVMLCIAAAGGISLTNVYFWERMTTIGTQDDGKRDVSAQHRLMAWDGAWQMAKDFPLGVGAGNFFDHIGRYYPVLEGRDTHNTYFRCLAELGFHGLFVLILLILNAYWMLSRIHKTAAVFEKKLRSRIQLYVYAMKTAMVIYLTAAIFISSTYIEELYWLLLFPVFLKRSVENEMETA